MHVRKKDLDDALDALQRASNNGRDYAYDHANGGYRLVSANGAVEISPRLPKREMYNWVWAYVEGIHAGRQAAGVDHCPVCELAQWACPRHGDES